LAIHVTAVLSYCYVIVNSGTVEVQLTQLSQFMVQIVTSLNRKSQKSLDRWFTNRD